MAPFVMKARTSRSSALRAISVGKLRLLLQADLDEQDDFLVVIPVGHRT
jgi:hypothetical protein